MQPILTSGVRLSAAIFLSLVSCKPTRDNVSSRPASRPQSATAALADLDPRQPVPLQPMMAWHQKQNMMEHLSVIQRITGALATSDWNAAAAAAKSIGSSDKMQQMCEHMGAGADGFTEMALDFHRRADAIADAANTKNMADTLAATSATLQVCTGCHAKFRQDVVDEATWRTRVAK